MLYTCLLTIATLVSGGVLPSIGRPRTERLSRGPAWTDFRDLAINETAVATAKSATQGTSRVAVVAVPTAESTSPDAAEVATELIRSGLMYGDKLIVVDADTSRTLFGSQRDPESILKTAKENDIDRVVLVKANDDSLASVDVYGVTDDSLTELVPYKVSKGTESVVMQAVSYPKLLLQQLDSLPHANIDSLGRIPQANFETLTHYVNAKAKLASIVGIKNEAQRKQVCEQVLAEVQLALDASPNFLEAYIVKASCQDELDQSTELKQTLTTAFQKIDPSKHDQLTVLELQGDYARFVQTNQLTALEAYQKLLEHSPNDLTGLWAIIDILLTGNGITAADNESIAAAAELAATVVAAHPQSSVAHAIMSKSE